MRAAPAVQATLAPDPGWAIFMRALAASALAGLTAWAAQWLPAPAAAAGLAAALAALVGWFLGPMLVAPHAGSLHWDGAAWSWQAQGWPQAQPGTVAVMIDLGPWMLLRFVPTGAAAVWLPVAEAACGSAWRPLRAALHARGAAE